MAFLCFLNPFETLAALKRETEVSERKEREHRERKEAETLNSQPRFKPAAASQACVRVYLPKMSLILF